MNMPARSRGIAPVNWDRVHRLRQASEESSRRYIGRYIPFILFSLYYFTTIGTVTDEMLLREVSLTLPLLNVSLPLLPFFIVVPVIYVAFHVHLLVQVYFWAHRHSKLKAYLEHAQSAERNEYLLLTHPTALGHWMMDMARDPIAMWLVRASIWTTLVLGPACLLLFTQRSFLAYHSLGVTWIHRACLLTDLAVVSWVWWFVCQFRDGADLEKVSLPPNSRRADALPTQDRLQWILKSVVRVFNMIGTTYRTLVYFIVCLFLGFCSFLVFTVPGERLDFVASGPPQHDGLWSKIRHRHLSLTDLVLFETNYLPACSATLSSTSEELASEVRRGRMPGIDLRGRDLRYADFTGSVLRNAKFPNARLDGARFDHADLSGTRFSNPAPADRHRLSVAPATLRGASFDFASANGVNFSGVDLSDVSMCYAHCNGAKFVESDFDGTNLSGCGLRLASFVQATFNDTIFRHATFDGADFTDAVMPSCEFIGNSLVGAMFHGALLDNSLFDNAELAGAHLTNVSAKGIVLRNMTEKNLLGTRLWGDLAGKTETQCDISRCVLSADAVADCDPSGLAIPAEFDGHRSAVRLVLIHWGVSLKGRYGEDLADPLPPYSDNIRQINAAIRQLKDSDSEAAFVMYRLRDFERRLALTCTSLHRAERQMQTAAPLPVPAQQQPTEAWGSCWYEFGLFDSSSPASDGPAVSQ